MGSLEILKGTKCKSCGAISFKSGDILGGTHDKKQELEK